jgi:hypothetical protein
MNRKIHSGNIGGNIEGTVDQAFWWIRPDFS